MRPKTPCRECDDRQVGCHINCEKYKEFKDELEKISKAKTKYKQTTYFARARSWDKHDRRRVYEHYKNK